MIKRTVLVYITGFLLISCASMNAKQPFTIEQIEGFTPVFTPVSSPEITESRTTVVHLGPVQSLAAVQGTNIFFSAGKDGFVTCHNPEQSDETWQISDISLNILAVHPDGNLIAFYESDGFSIHRISVWDWKNKKRLYAKRFRDSVISLSWSAKGTYLMIGNTSLEGITILEGSSASVQSFFTVSPGIVSLSITGSTETNMITYGPSGRILYTDITTQKERANYSGEQDLSSPVLLNNNLFIAGYKENAVFLIDATSGKTISTYATGKPVMATGISDTKPVWFEENETGDWILRSGLISSPGFRTPDNSTITTAISFENSIVFGTASGMIYSIEKKSDNSSAPLASALVENTHQIIDDIASDGSRLFFLSAGSVFISSGPGKAPVFAFDGLAANRLIIMKDSLICWSTNRSEPVLRISFDGETRKLLYQPKEGIRSISITGDKIAIIEGNSLASVLDTATEAVSFNYSGAGLQDAILISSDRLVVSKSSTLRSPYPLILINTSTGETVPLPVTGELCFGIKQSENDFKILNGFIVRSGLSSSTELVTILLDLQTVGSTAVKTEAIYADEDLVASVLVDGDHIITNLGKNSLVEIKMIDGNQEFFERGYALPLKPCVMDQFLVSLNYDGSLTWFNRFTHELVLSSSMTTKGMWKEQ